MYLKMVFALLTKSQYSHGRINYLLHGLSRIGLKDGLTHNHVHTFINWQCHSRHKDKSLYFTYIFFNRNKDTLWWWLDYMMIMAMMMIMMIMMMIMMINKQDTAMQSQVLYNPLKRESAWLSGNRTCKFNSLKINYWFSEHHFLPLHQDHSGQSFCVLCLCHRELSHAYDKHKPTWRLWKSHTTWQIL